VTIDEGAKKGNRFFAATLISGFSFKDRTSFITKLKQGCRPHASADTHGLHAVFYALLLHIV
jgi:hypothetical protein